MKQTSTMRKILGSVLVLDVDSGIVLAGASAEDAEGHHRIKLKGIENS